MVAHVCDSSTRAMEAVGPGVRGQPEDRGWATDWLKKKRNKKSWRDGSGEDKRLQTRHQSPVCSTGKGKNISSGG